MLQRVLGEEIMRRGLMLYLERHQYGNANMDDLWHALSLGTLNSSHPVPVKVVYFLLIFLILRFGRGEKFTTWRTCGGGAAHF